MPPNALPFSRRKRIAKNCQKANDLARAAVGWNGGLGALATHAGLLPACAHHPGTESRPHNGRLMESPHAPDHTEHDGQTAPRAIAPRRHHGRWHDETGTTGVRIRDRCMGSKRDCRPRCPAAQQLGFSRARQVGTGMRDRESQHVATDCQKLPDRERRLQAGVGARYSFRAHRRRSQPHAEGETSTYTPAACCCGNVCIMA
jgi:hypothetical protein